MASHKILMSNLGYLRGIDGRLMQHLRYAHRHIYCPVNAQKNSLSQLLCMIEAEDPDVCCFVEIEKGSGYAGFNQLEALVGNAYPFFDIENKYGEKSLLRRFSHTRGKSNAFIAKKNIEYEKIYFAHGTKRLIYKIFLDENLSLFFTHFSLKRPIRALQIRAVKKLLEETPGETIFLGDFNIISGFAELAPLLDGNKMHLLSREDVPTFTFHRFKKALDICLCSPSLAPKLNLRILPQSFSDHAALMVTVEH